MIDLAPSCPPYRFRLDSHRHVPSRVPFQFQLWPPTTHTTLLLPSAPTKTLDPPTASQPASRRRKAAQNPKPETLEIRSVGGGEASGQGGMSGGRRGAGGELAEEEVVPMEDAVKMLVEHLVKPALPRGAVFGAAQGERYMAPDKQRAVAQQVSSSRR